MRWIGLPLLPAVVLATGAALYLGPRNLRVFRLMIGGATEGGAGLGWARAAWVTSLLSLFTGGLAPFAVVVSAVLVIAARARGAGNVPEARVYVKTAAENAFALGLLCVLVLAGLAVEARS